MKTKEEILAKIENLMQEMQQLRNEVAALELVNPVVQDTVENVDKMDELADSTQVIEDEVEELPAPPEEVEVKIPKRYRKPDPEAVMGCQIRNKVVEICGDFYDGVCDSLVLQKQWFDNTDKGYTKLCIHKANVVVRAYDINGKLLGKTIIRQEYLNPWNKELIKRKLYDHHTSSDPHKNWLPYEVNLVLGD